MFVSRYFRDTARHTNLNQPAVVGHTSMSLTVALRTIPLVSIMKVPLYIYNDRGRGNEETKHIINKQIGWQPEVVAQCMNDTGSITEIIIGATGH